MTRIPSQRTLFSIPEQVSYLNTAYMAPQLRSITEKGVAALHKKEHPWEIGLPEFFDPTENLRSLFAQILGTSPEGIALVPSVSYGIGVAAKNTPVKTGGEILLLEEQFPSNVYPWQARSKESGETVRMIARQGDDWTGPLLDAISPNTSLVAIPHCHWTDGTKVDLEAVGAATKRVGASLVLDLTQSLGALPLSLERVAPDFVVCAAYKWLLGPYSMGFMYVAPEHRDGDPLEYNWITRKDSHLFAELVNYRESFEPGSRRFDVGQRSNFFLTPMAEEALRHLVGWGVDSIAETLSHHTQSIVQKAEARGWSAPIQTCRAPHMVGIRSPKPLPEDFLATLAAKGVYVSLRGTSVRISPHLHTSEDDIARLFSALDSV